MKRANIILSVTAAALVLFSWLCAWVTLVGGVRALAHDPPAGRVIPLPPRPRIERKKQTKNVFPLPRDKDGYNASVGNVKILSTWFLHTTTAKNNSDNVCFYHFTAADDHDYIMPKEMYGSYGTLVHSAGCRLCSKKRFPRRSTPHNFKSSQRTYP